MVVTVTFTLISDALKMVQALGHDLTAALLPQNTGTVAGIQPQIHATSEALVIRLLRGLIPGLRMKFMKCISLLLPDSKGVRIDRIRETPRHEVGRAFLFPMRKVSLSLLDLVGPVEWLELEGHGRNVKQASSLSSSNPQAGSLFHMAGDTG